MANLPSMKWSSGYREANSVRQRELGLVFVFLSPLTQETIPVAPESQLFFSL
jgi:hypothetical protein